MEQKLRADFTGMLLGKKTAQTLPKKGATPKNFPFIGILSDEKLPTSQE